MLKIGLLEIFVSAGCPGCAKAMELARWIRQVKPRLTVNVVDLTQAPEAGAGLVVAVPTYLYNQEPVFLGNPSAKELTAWLDIIDPED